MLFSCGVVLVYPPYEIYIIPINTFATLPSFLSIPKFKTVENAFIESIENPDQYFSQTNSERLILIHTCKQ